MSISVMDDIKIYTIPTKYICEVVIIYKDGRKFIIEGRDCNLAFPILRKGSMMELLFQLRNVMNFHSTGYDFINLRTDPASIDDIQVNLNMDKLNDKVDSLVEEYLGKYC